LEDSKSLKGATYSVQQRKMMYKSWGKSAFYSVSDAFRVQQVRVIEQTKPPAEYYCQKVFLLSSLTRGSACAFSPAPNLCFSDSALLLRPRFVLSRGNFLRGGFAIAERASAIQIYANSTSLRRLKQTNAALLEEARSALSLERVFCC